MATPWCLSVHQSACWLLGSLSITTTCYKGHTSILGPSHFVPTLNSNSSASLTPATHSPYNPAILVLYSLFLPLSLHFLYSLALAIFPSLKDRPGHIQFAGLCSVSFLLSLLLTLPDVSGSSLSLISTIKTFSSPYHGAVMSSAYTTLPSRCQNLRL